MNVRAMGIRRFGGPEEFDLLEFERPVPGGGQVLIKQDFAGVNFIDVYMRNGTYAKSDTYQTPLPIVLGMEGAGVVAEVGPDCDFVSVGDRIFPLGHVGLAHEMLEQRGTKGKLLLAVEN